MKSTFILLIISLIVPLNSFSQRINIFSDPNNLKEFLDKKTYIVPNYGEIRFDFDNKEDGYSLNLVSSSIYANFPKALLFPG